MELHQGDERAVVPDSLLEDPDWVLSWLLAALTYATLSSIHTALCVR